MIHPFVYETGASVWLTRSRICAEAEAARISIEGRDLPRPMLSTPPEPLVEPSFVEPAEAAPKQRKPYLATLPTPTLDRIAAHLSKAERPLTAYEVAVLMTGNAELSIFDRKVVKFAGTLGRMLRLERVVRVKIANPHPASRNARPFVFA